mmetsp:Transcript_66886/g.172216  ORF Transcript_66886/g.172216 Transcript_66886/m.172216 type:complete len:435 (-) Transcript_66886:498-1802(-)
MRPCVEAVVVVVPMAQGLEEVDGDLRLQVHLAKDRGVLKNDPAGDARLLALVQLQNVEVPGVELIKSDLQLRELACQLVARVWVDVIMRNLGNAQQRTPLLGIQRVLPLLRAEHQLDYTPVLVLEVLHGLGLVRLVHLGRDAGNFPKLIDDLLEHVDLVIILMQAVLVSHVKAHHGHVSENRQRLLLDRREHSLQWRKHQVRDRHRDERHGTDRAERCEEDEEDVHEGLHLPGVGEVERGLQHASVDLQARGFHLRLCELRGLVKRVGAPECRVAGALGPEVRVPSAHEVRPIRETPVFVELLERNHLLLPSSTAGVSRGQDCHPGLHGQVLARNLHEVQQWHRHEEQDGQAGRVHGDGVHQLLPEDLYALIVPIRVRCPQTAGAKGVHQARCPDIAPYPDAHRGTTAHARDHQVVVTRSAVQGATRCHWCIIR